MKQLGLMVMMMLFVGFGFAQSNETMTVKTSAQCGMCKKRIEEKLNYTKGVKFAELNLENKELTVKYRTDKISKDQVLAMVSDMGYNAGSVKRNETAHSKLPGCCQSKTTKAKACCSGKRGGSCSKQ